ncbi:MAG: AI-2E family transporter [Bacteroidota bacterium]
MSRSRHALRRDKRAMQTASPLSLWSAGIALLGIVAFAWIAPDLFGLVVLGAVLAYLLVPIVDRMERRGMNRTVGSALVLVLLTLVLVVLGIWLVPLLSEQGAELQEKWRSGEILGLLEQAEAMLAAHLPVDPGQLGLVAAAQQAIQADSEPLIVYLPDALEMMGNAFIVPFVLFALLKDGPNVRRRLVSLVPNPYFEFAMSVLYKADAHLGDYLRGQALIAVLVGASTAIGLGLLGVPYYLVLGLLTGLANFVPYIGFVVSAALTMAVSVLATGSFEQAVWVFVLFVVLQSIENVVFQPWITGKNVSMHPVLVLLAILIGGRIGGVLGMALGVPAAAILKVVAVETVVNLRRYHL